MHLVLKWKSKGNKIYALGVLSRESNKYIFEIDENELKKAIKDGCMGIGDFDFLKMKLESDELFSFFKHRIPNKKSWKIDEVLKKYNLDTYDEMQLLSATGGRSINDRYWLEKV